MQLYASKAAAGQQATSNCTAAAQTGAGKEQVQIDISPAFLFGAQERGPLSPRFSGSAPLGQAPLLAAGPSGLASRPPSCLGSRPVSCSSAAGGEQNFPYKSSHNVLRAALVGLRSWGSIKKVVFAIDSKPPAEGYAEVLGRRVCPGTRGAIHPGSASDYLPLMGVTERGRKRPTRCVLSLT
jgi:hypothetical protein